MKALIVDGEEIFRVSLREIVTIVGNFTDIIEAISENDFIRKTASHSEFDLIIIHPETLANRGSDCIKLVRRLYPATPILSIVANLNDAHNELTDTHIVARSASVMQMIATVRKIMGLSESSVGTQITRVNLSRFVNNDNIRPANAGNPADLERLSYRQKQILSMAANGMPNKEIAAQLSIAEGTVKAHMHAIFKALGVSNRTQAVLRFGAANQLSGGNISTEYSASVAI